MYTKKIVSIILVIAMALSVFAMTASADGEPAPAYLVDKCSRCNSTNCETTTQHRVQLHTHAVTGLECMQGYHTHFCYGSRDVFYCNDCGYTRYSNAVVEYALCMTGSPVEPDC